MTDKKPCPCNAKKYGDCTCPDGHRCDCYGCNCPYPGTAPRKPAK